MNITVRRSHTPIPVVSLSWSVEALLVLRQLRCRITSLWLWIIRRRLTVATRGRILHRLLRSGGRCGGRRNELLIWWLTGGDNYSSRVTVAIIWATGTEATRNNRYNDSNEDHTSNNNASDIATRNVRVRVRAIRAALVDAITAFRSVTVRVVRTIIIAIASANVI